MTEKRILGTVTIGQSPRVDLIPEMKEFLGPGIEIVEGGALDGLTLEQVAEFYPTAGEPVLVTRMADGTSVKITEKHILPRMQSEIDRLAREGAEIIALVCTGKFPVFNSDRLIVRPERILFNAVSAVATNLRIGYLMPDAAQAPKNGTRWDGVASAVRGEPASPYGPFDRIVTAAENLKAWGAQIVVMNCIGYTSAMKKAVKDITGVPVILARSILARTLSELL